MSKHANQLTFAEISSLIKARKIDELFSPIEATISNVEKKVFLKVTKAENQQADFTVGLSGQAYIDLVRDSMAKRKVSMAIAPDNSLVERKYTKVGNPPTFFVSPAVYEAFIQDAQQIYSEYCQQGMNFGHIPYPWFENLKLVQFIVHEVWDDPYVQERRASGHSELGTDWSVERLST